MTRALPERIGPYKILDVLGEGGMGVVYRARASGDAPAGPSARAGRGVAGVDSARVAIKTVRVPQGTSVAGIRAEIVALSRIQHPSIVKILGEGVEGGIPWYAMELLDGITMREHHRALWQGFVRREDAATEAALADRGTFEEALDPEIDAAHASRQGPRSGAGLRRTVAGGRLREVLTMMRRLCAPLAYLHGRGIVHRDLKPGNVFLRPDGTPVLMDFGLVARFRGGVGREALEVGGLLVGTAAYMAPEQAMGLLVDARADLYSFGVILYEMLTGEVPFSGGTTRALLERHVKEPPTPPSTLVEGVSERLDALILRLLAKKPRDRFGYAEDVAAELAELGAERSPEVRSRTYLYRPDLSGRDAPLARLERAIERLSDGVGGCVLVGGESGVGKTSLVARAARKAALSRFQVVAGECLPIAVSGASTPGARESDRLPGGPAASVAPTLAPVSSLQVKGAPLHPFRPLLQIIADRCREGGREVTDRLLGRRGPVLAPYEPALLELPGQAERPPPPELPVEAAYRRVLDHLAETVAVFVAEVGPVLLLLDDLQWADELSQSFLASLPDDYFERRPLLLFGTFRSDEVSAQLEPILERAGKDVLHLDRLDERTVGAIVADMLALPRPPAAFVRFLAQQTEGNPFFIAEYLRAAVEEGFLCREQGAWRVSADAQDDEVPMSTASFEALPLPRSLRELVGRRVMGLGDETRALLEVASVLGREVQAGVLARAAGVSEAEAMEALKDLGVRQVLVPVEGDRLRFAHDKLREITYARVPAERRRALHRAAAEALERDLASTTQIALHYSELAHHWTAAEVWTKAVRYLERAGEQALRDFSNREAIRFFRQALALSGRMDERPGPVQLARWERSLVEAHQGLGEDALSLVHAERALRHCGRPVPASALGRVLGFVVQCVLRVVRGWLPARKVASPVERALVLEAAYVSQRMLEPSFRNNEPLLGTYCGLRSLNLAEKVPLSAPLARGYAFMCMIVGLTPLQGVARSWSERALRYAEELGSEPLIIYCLSRVGCHSMSAARWRDAEAQLGGAIERASRLGDRRQHDEGLSLLFVAHHANGRFDESVKLSRQGLASGEERGDLQTQGWARNCLAEGLTRLGRTAEALSLLASGRAWRERAAEDTEALWAEVAEALAQLSAGAPDAARAAADAALARIRRRAPVQFYLGAPLSELSEVYVALWEDAAGTDRARPIAAGARAAAAALWSFSRIVPFTRPAAHRARGEVAWLDGRPRAALKAWRRALADARRLEMPYEEARAHLTLGIHVEAPAEAAEHLRRAITLLTPRGAAADLLRARAALEELRT